MEENKKEDIRNEEENLVEEGLKEEVEEAKEDSATEELVEEEPLEEKADKKFFGKKKKEKKDPKDEKIMELNDRLMRQMAEFDNYRKRTEKEKSSMYIVGAKEVVEKLLPIIDNFERGLAVPEAEAGNPFVEGMQMIYKQMLTMFEEIGVKQIEALGQPFDPNLHNAVLHVEDENVGENEIVEEFQKGYTYKDFVVRHSMVKVAN
ncbi:MAG TPA: nucleotide exchange factor GrpE [Lachnospiraceae bacterium]